MNYNITINTKSKSYPITTNNLEGFLEILKNNGIIWLGGQSQGFWIPHAEIIEIIFQQQDSEAVQAVEDPSSDQILEAVMEHAQAEALIHQQQTIEG